MNAFGGFVRAAESGAFSLYHPAVMIVAVVIALTDFPPSSNALERAWMAARPR